MIKSIKQIREMRNSKIKITKALEEQKRGGTAICIGFQMQIAILNDILAYKLNNFRLHT